MSVNNEEKRKIVVSSLFALAKEGSFYNTQTCRQIQELIDGDFKEELSQLAKRVSPKGFNEAREEIEQCEKHGIQTICISDQNYPSLLRTIPDPPIVLFVKGEINSAPKLAIVGSRKASEYGLKSARILSEQAAVNGLTIVSGLANGIDQAALESASDNNLPSIAVIGSGFSQIYPKSNLPLAKRILNSSGAIVSEYGFYQGPRQHLFPRRNRIISGLCGGVLVVEAAKRSGSLITARLALEQGREVFAVPGQIDSATSDGCNLLLKNGANITHSFSDIAEHFNIVDVSLSFEVISHTKKVENIFKQDKEQLSIAKKIVKKLKRRKSLSTDVLLESNSADVNQHLAVLNKLELKGMIKRKICGRYQLVP